MHFTVQNKIEKIVCNKNSKNYFKTKKSFFKNFKNNFSKNSENYFSKKSKKFEFDFKGIVKISKSHFKGKICQNVLKRSIPLRLLNVMKKIFNFYCRPGVG